MLLGFCYRRFVHLSVLILLLLPFWYASIYIHTPISFMLGIKLANDAYRKLFNIATRDLTFVEWFELTSAFLLMLLFIRMVYVVSLDVLVHIWYGLCLFIVVDLVFHTCFGEELFTMTCQGMGFLWCMYGIDIGLYSFGKILCVFSVLVKVYLLCWIYAL